VSRGAGPLPGRLVRSGTSSANATDPTASSTIAPIATTKNGVLGMPAPVTGRDRDRCASARVRDRAPTACPAAQERQCGNDARNVSVGMMQGGVLNIAGSPQRREAMTTASGPIEIWFYVVTASAGGFEERPIVFANGQVIAIGRDALTTVSSQQAASGSQDQEALYRAFVAAYLSGYEKGRTDRDLEWSQAIQKVAPQFEGRVREAESKGYTAGQKAGAQRALEQVQAAFDWYLRDAQREEQQKSRERATKEIRIVRYRGIIHLQPHSAQFDSCRKTPYMVRDRFQNIFLAAE